MSAHYFSTGLCIGACHTWARWVITTPPGFWFVSGHGDFTTAGFATVDDFGTLVFVEVAK